MCEHVDEDEKRVLNRFITEAKVPCELAAELHTLANTSECLTVERLSWLLAQKLPPEIRLLIIRVQGRCIDYMLEPF